MTEARRKKAAERFRELLDAGVPRKKALLQVREEFKDPSTSMLLGRATLYRYCARFSVSVR